MKIKAALTKILTNKLVLHVVFFIAFINIITYVVMGNIDAVIYFILLGVLIGNFSKNMIIVLGVPVILVNLFVISKHRRVEGFTDASGNGSSSKKGSSSNGTPSTSSTSQDPIIPSDEPNNPLLESTSSSSSSSSSSGPSESFEVGRDKKKGGYDIDYAATIEDAYDELNKVIGGDGIKKLTQDTQGLMNQQLQLAEAMKGMGPLIKGMAPIMKQAEGLLGGMKENGGLEGIAAMAKKFTDASK
jgi:hypothetical protein